MERREWVLGKRLGMKGLGEQNFLRSVVIDFSRRKKTRVDLDVDVL